MKKFFVAFALFVVLIFIVSCGGGSKSVNQGDEPDTGEAVTDKDTADSEPDDSEPSDTEPDNDYPQTPCDPNPCVNDANSTGACTIENDSYVCGCNSGYIFDGTFCIKSLPECSPESATPCIDSATGLIWSAKSESKMPWNDAVEYCQNLTEGDFNDWRLPSIVVLKTLVQNCSSEKCTEDYTGIYSKFGDAVYLWSYSEGEDSTALSIYFSDASTQPVSIDANVNVRCVRREVESRQSNCTGLIENSVWNTATQITQTWDWETADWTPSPQGSYNAEGSSSECHFKCDSSSFWNGSSQCLNPCKPNPCTGIGETGTCLSKSANEYTCECENNYVWNPYSNECMKNPCNIPNSTGVYNPVSETQYTCECEENYLWYSDSNECKPPLTLGNICTGQDECYKTPNAVITCPTSESDDFYGQDAYYASLGKCTPQSFTVMTLSSQKVVYDNNTGLMWQQTMPNETYTWEEALSYCNDLTYAGYGDWRLPTPQELLTIVDSSRTHPAIDTTYFPVDFVTTTSSLFWSSSTRVSNVSDTNDAVTVDFYYGFMGYSDKTSKGYVHCVRGSTLPIGSFYSSTVNGDVIVTDTVTGLVWQKSYGSGNWQEALYYCETLIYAGYTDWRLPNKNELASLLNQDKSGASYSDFPDMPSSYFWSSSTRIHSEDEAWIGDFSFGMVSIYGKTSGWSVRCVR